MENPTYRRLGDHTETMQIDYDPTVISYDEILLLFWDNHNPTLQPWSRQYMSLIFTHNEGQREAATAGKKDFEHNTGSKIYTEIKPFERFYLAEDYHQKYYLQGEQVLFKEIQAYYQTFNELVDSTVAARLNGYVAGYGDPALIREEIRDYGLSSEGMKQLYDYLK